MSGNRSWIAVAAILLAPLCVGQLAHAQDLQLLPNGPADLLPEGTVAVVLSPNLAQLDEDVRAIVALFDEEAADDVDILELVEKGVKGVSEIFDTSGSAVVAISLPPGGPAAPGFTFIGKLANSDAQAPEILERSGMAAAHVLGGYAGLSTNPAYAPSEQRLTILDDMPAGDLSIRVDLETVVATFGPMLQAMIGMGMAGAASDSTRDFTLDRDQQNTVVDLLGRLLESAKTLDLSADYNGEELVLRSDFAVLAGSALSPGPQPDYGEALELARLLPHDHTLFSATAMSLDSLVDFYREAMALMASVGSQDLPHEIDEFYSHGMEKFTDSLALWKLPNAFSMGFTAGSPEMAGAIRGEDVPGFFDELYDFLADLGSQSDSFGIERSDFDAPGGWKAQRTEISIDFSDVMDDTDEDTAIMMAVFQALIPTVYHAHRDDLTLWMATSNSEDFLEFLAGVDQDTWPKIPPALEAAMEWSGEGTQSITTIEFRGLLNSAFDLVRGFIDIPVADEPPVRVDTSMKILGNHYAGALRVKLDDAAALIQELMEVFQRFDERQAEESETEEAALDRGLDHRPTGSLSLEEAAELAASLQPAIEEMRGHSFSREVPMAVVSDETAREHFLDRLRSELPEGQLEHLGRVYTDLGMLEEGADVLDEVLALLEEQAGGYYDPKSKSFYMLDDMPQAAAPVIIVHELTHALDDQVFDIDRAFATIAENNDALTAMGCVVEGSGTLVMSSWMTRELLQGRLDQKGLEAFGRSQAGQAEQLSRTPPVLANAMIAPYILGQRFLSRGNPLAAVSGIDAEDIDHAFLEPPASTEQVLHPEKYWEDERYDAPRRVELPDLAGDLPRTLHPAYSGVMGELDLATLTGYRIDFQSGADMMSAAVSTPAATGWDGDRVLNFVDGNRSLTVVAIVFDSPTDAVEFADSVELPAAAQISVAEDRVALVCGDTGDLPRDFSTTVLKRMRVEE